MVFILNNGSLTPVAIQTGLSDGIKIEVKSGELTTKSELVVGIKQNGVVVPQSKGLIQTPQRTTKALIKIIMQAVISVKNIFKIYKMGSQTLAALNDVSMDVFPGEYIAIMGSSGSGKSTFMNIVGCLDVPTRGEYLFNGESVISKSKIQLAHLRRDNIGFVFQSFNLLSRTTAYDNVELPLLYCNIPASERKIKVEKALTSVGLKDRMNSMPNMLSGGQQQRVAIARAIVNNPKIILADEPTGNLDTRTSMEIIQIFQLLNDEGITIVMVTHEDDIARSSKKRVVFRDGKMLKTEDTDDRLIASEQIKLLPAIEEIIL